MKEIIRRFDYNQTPEVAILLKSNFLVDFEDYREADNLSEIGKMEWMLIQTAFYMTQKLKEKNGEYNFNAETEFVISMDEFCNLWQIPDIKKKKADGSIYRDVKKALIDVMKIQFSYPRIDNGEISRSGYFSEISYADQHFSFYIPNGIIGYIKSYGSYTWYFFENMVKLQNDSGASRLYELICKSKHQKDISDVDGNCYFEVEIPLHKLRQILAPDKYPETKKFNRHALLPAINFISEKTSMKLSLEGTVRKGRNIDGYVFGVTLDESELDLRNAFKIERNKKPLMNEEQRVKFSLLLVSDSIYSAYEPQLDGEKVPVYITRIKNLLKDNNYVEKIYEAFLRPTGYRHQHLELKLKAKLEAKELEKKAKDAQEIDFIDVSSE